MKTTFINDSIAVSEFTNAAFVFSSAKNKEASTAVVFETKEKTGKVASWGPNNDAPQKIMESIKKSGAAKSGLRFNKKAHYGNGLILTRENYEGGKKENIPVPLTELKREQEFFRRSQMKKFWKETISDLETFSIAFPEYILSADFSQINRVKRQRAAWFRFEAMNDNGYIDNVYISEQWGRSAVDLEGKYAAKVPVIDPYWSAEEVKEYCKKKRIYKFIRPVFYPLTDEPYYPFADWHAVNESGWLEVANSIPEYKKALFSNQISIKYLIEIDERYFEQIYKHDWEDFSTDDKKEKRQEVIDAINEHLGGSSKAGKSIQSMRIDVGDGQTVSAIDIKAIDDKFKEGMYLPEASAANSEILFAMGVDPVLISAGIPGGKLGAGSGSDKREAFLIVQALMKTNRETTLEVFEFIQEYNNWDLDIVPVFESTILTTLDKNPTGQQKVVN
tara:strand:- start:48062 stop:49402 length:1341 start_codon:yes stop_codon:yes gene_type:complete